MDYTNFIKNYCIIALNKIDKFNTYVGTIATLGYGPDFSSSDYHVKNHNLSILPNYEPNISSPINVFLEFNQFLSKYLPELSTVFAGEEGIKLYYNLAVKKGFIDDDEKTLDFINLIIEINIEAIKKAGILSGNNF